ncbi:MAG TPA: argininosuccinate lyase [Thermodesulfovibrionales bacterium]|nr:argininosuccinate lyase [Thermodesulfovibrionales bacterium]
MIKKLTKAKKPWGGRFTEKTSKSAESFTESISFDYRLWRYDIEGSIAHAGMLGRQGIIPKKDSAKIIKGLEEIAREIETGKFSFKEDLEDVHMNIEAALTEKIGDAGGRLHTARSRNDQVALDLRLYLRAEIKEILSLLKAFQTTLLTVAERHLQVLMPGYTHMQRAQPVLLSHHLLAYVEMLLRDADRFSDNMKRLNRLPLGACALAGTTFPIDRDLVAKELGFDGIVGNSIDAVSDRDFAIEFLSASSILIMHLSRLAEELVLWTTEEFRFIELPDAFTTGSSIMPQKKNPDVAELVRGKTGRVYGNLFSLLTIMKGLPLSYNRDLQEDKLPVFDTVDTIKACLSVLNDMFPGITVNTKRISDTAGDAYSTATDIAEYLVKKGMPFRKAHEATGKIVLYCIRKGKKFDELSIKELRDFSDVISRDIYSCLSPEESVKNKLSAGSTSAKEVRKQIKKLSKIVRHE